MLANYKRCFTTGLLMITLTTIFMLDLVRFVFCYWHYWSFLWKILCNFHILVRWMVITFRTKMICIYYPRNLSVSKIAKDFPLTFPFNKLILLVLQCTYFFRLNIEMQPLFKKPKIKWVKVFSSTIPDKWN